MILRLTAALLALAAGAVAVTLAALVMHRTPGPVSTASAPAQLPAAPSPSPRFPAPPAGAVVFSREDGPDALALALVPHGSRLIAQVSVVGQQGTGVNGRAVSIDSTPAVSCGDGCYRASVPRSQAIDVTVGKTRWVVPLPSPWPAPDASTIVARAARVWRSLHSIAFSDRLGSDATHVVVSEWRAIAPDRLAYVIQGGYSAVIVGGTRWDRAPGGRWVASPQTPQLRQPVPVWQSETDAHIVGRARGTLRITFYDPRTPAWFAITVDARTQRTLDLHMITTAHFMHEQYGSFDAPLSIAPPR